MCVCVYVHMCKCFTHVCTNDLAYTHTYVNVANHTLSKYKKLWSLVFSLPAIILLNVQFLNFKASVP